MKMLLINVAMLCCLFTFNQKNTVSGAITVHLKNRNRPSSEISHEKRKNKENISIQFTRVPLNRQFSRQPLQSNKRQINISFKKRPKKSETNRQPVNFSFEPIGALKLDGLTRGQLDVDFGAVGKLLTSAATGAVSHLQDLPNYLPSFDYFQGNANEDDLSSQNNDDDSKEEKDMSQDKSHDEDESESERDSDQKDSESDQSKEIEDDDQSKENEDESSKENDTSEEDNKSESKHEETISPEDTSEQKDISKSSQADTSKPEEPPKPSLVENLQKYYSYAKPLVKTASLFFPATAPFRHAMLALDMVDLAYQTSLMYTEGEGMLSIGYFLGKEAFSRLGRRSDLEPKNIPLPIDFSTEVSSAEAETFLDLVQNTKYPELEENKENRIRQMVSETIDKYIHEEDFKDEAERTRFIDLMTLCVKFIALQISIDVTDGGLSSQ